MQRKRPYVFLHRPPALTQDKTETQTESQTETQTEPWHRSGWYLGADLGANLAQSMETNNSLDATDNSLYTLLPGLIGVTEETKGGWRNTFGQVQGVLLGGVVGYRRQSPDWLKQLLSRY